MQLLKQQQQQNKCFIEIYYYFVLSQPIVPKISINRNENQTSYEENEITQEINVFINDQSVLIVDTQVIINFRFFFSSLYIILILVLFKKIKLN